MCNRSSTQRKAGESGPSQAGAAHAGAEAKVVAAEDDGVMRQLTNKKLPRFRRRSSVERFQAGLADGFASFNPDLSCSVAMDGGKIGWHHGPHCMNCYLGQEHTCWDPQYAKEMDGILRRVFFVKKAHLGGFELDAKRTGKGDDYAVITYIVRYAPRTLELPHHDHPHGEEYLVLRGSFDSHDGELGYTPAPAMTYVKYPHGTEHRAQPNIEEGCDVLTWWGQNNNDEEAAELPWWRESHPRTAANTAQICDTTFRAPGEPGSAWRPSSHGVGFELELFRSAGASRERTWMLHVPAVKEAAGSRDRAQAQPEEEADESTALKQTKGTAADGLAPGRGRALYHVPAGGLEMYVVRGSFEMDSTVFESGYWLREAPCRNSSNSEGGSRLSIFPSVGSYILMKANHLTHLE